MSIGHPEFCIPSSWGGGNFLLQAVPEKEFSKLNEYERAFRILEGKD